MDGGKRSPENQISEMEAKKVKEQKCGISFNLAPFQTNEQVRQVPRTVTAIKFMVTNLIS